MSCASAERGSVRAGAVAPAPSAKSFEEWVRDADVALEGGDPEAALEALKEARTLEPDHPELLFLFGRAYEKAGADGAAYLAFAGYVEGGGTTEHVRWSREALASLGDSASAPLTRLLRELMKEEPSEAMGFVHLVRGYDEKYPVMRDDFRAASCEFLSLLAAAAFEEKQPKDAELIGRYALEFTKRCPLAFAIVARSAILRGDRAEGERMFQGGLENNPGQLLFHRDLAAFYREDGDYERAAVHLMVYADAVSDPDDKREAEALLADMERRIRFAGAMKKLVGSPELPRASGTGFVVSRDGYALTAAHVVKAAKRVKAVDADGRLWDAEVVVVDDEEDVAVVKLRGTWRPLALAARPAELGAEVFTVGYPDIDVLGFSPKLASGVVSSTAGPLDAPHLMQISVPIQPGNSGGPVVDERGNVVGLVVGRMLPGSYENVAYAVSVDRMRGLLDERGEVLRSSKRPRKKGRGKNAAAQAKGAVVLVLAW